MLQRLILFCIKKIACTVGTTRLMFTIPATFIHCKLGTQDKNTYHAKKGRHTKFLGNRPANWRDHRNDRDVMSCSALIFSIN